MKNKFILGVVFFTLAVFCAGSVLAQEAGNSQEESNASKEDRANPEEGRLVATVNFYVVEIKNPGNNEFEITFVANNAENVQPGIRYAISLQREKDSHQEVFARKVYDEVLSLGPGETVERTVKYSAPKNLSGEFDLFLESASTDGLLLAIVNGGKVKIEGDENLPSEKVGSLNPDPNQSQYITNVRFDKDYYKKGDQAKIILDVMPMQIEGGEISLSITGENQKSCLAGEFWEGDFSVNKNGANELAVEIYEECFNPVLAVSIKGKNGEIIDEGKYAVESKSEGAKSAMDEKNRQEKKMAMINRIVMIGIIVFVLAVLVFSIVRKIKYRNYYIPIFFLVFSFGLAFFVSPAGAHTNVAYDYSYGDYGVPINRITYVKNVVSPAREGGTVFYRPDDLNADGTVTWKINVSVTRELVAAPGCTSNCANQNFINTVANHSILAKIDIINVNYSELVTRFTTNARYRGYDERSRESPINDYLVLPRASMGASVTIARQYQFNDDGGSSYYGPTNSSLPTDPASLVHSAIIGEDYVNGELFYVPYALHDGYYLKDPLGVCSSDLRLEDIHCGGCNSDPDLPLWFACKYGVGANFSISNFSTSDAKALWQCNSNVTGGTSVNCSQNLSWKSECGELADKPICNLGMAQQDDWGGYDLCDYESSAIEQQLWRYWGPPRRYNPRYADVLPPHASDMNPSSFLATGPWSWTCNGFGGTKTSCQTTLGTIAACGTATSTTSVGRPTLNLCAPGSVLGPWDTTKSTTPQSIGNGAWQWYCTIQRGNNLGCDATCTTPQGGCVSDSANLIYYADPPTGSQLCFDPNPSDPNDNNGFVSGSFSGDGDLSPWTWSCMDSKGQIHNNCQAKKIDASLKVNGSESSPAFVNAGVNANFDWDSVNAYQCRRSVAPSSDSNWTANWSSASLAKDSSNDFQPINGNTYSFSCRVHGTGIYSTPYYQDTASITVNLSTPTASCGADNRKSFCTESELTQRCGSGSNPSIISLTGGKFTWDCTVGASNANCSATKYCSTDDIWKEINP